MPLLVEGMSQMELDTIMDQPLAEFPPRVLEALPQADLSQFPVPSVFRDRHRHLCILVAVGRKYAACIPFDLGGLRVLRLPHAQFGYSFEHLADTPVEEALPAFSRAARYGASVEAAKLLDSLTKEILVKNLNVLIIAAAVDSVFPNKKSAQEAFEKLPEKKSKQPGTLVATSAADLTQLSVAELTSVYNSVAAKQVKKLGDKSVETAERVFEAIRAKFSGGAKEDAPKVDADDKADKEPKARTVKGNAGAATEKRQGPRPESKMGKMLAALQAKGGATVDELVKASGYDDKNVRTAVGILRAGRVSGGVKYNVVLDKETSKYRVQA